MTYVKNTTLGTNVTVKSLEEIVSEKVAEQDVNSNVEVDAAKVDAYGTTYLSLKVRMDTEQQQNKDTSDRVVDLEKKTNWLDVKDYGAVGDGTTIDQQRIEDAVNDAIAKGAGLNWSRGTYVSNANIPNFHMVRHRGEGIIKRGTDLFYIEPKGTQTNKIYANPAGSNTNDGLSANEPVRQYYTIVNLLGNYANPILTGTWEFVLSAGTHDRRASLPAGIRSENPIIFSGPDVGGHPNVPTAIISEGTGVAAVGIQASNGTKIKVKNIKFTGFNGSSSSAGIKVTNNSEVETENVHTDSCYWGVTGEGRSKITVPDGIHSNNGYLYSGGGTGGAFRSLQLNNHSIGKQNNGSNTGTCIIQNCYSAILAQESSTGHMDWCTVQDCANGLLVRVNARVNCDGTLFKRNGADMRVDGNGHVYISNNVQFATGADESTNKVVTSAGGNVTNSTMVSGVELAYSTIEKAFVMQSPNQTIQTTSATVFYTATLKAPLWRGTPTTSTPMKKLYFRIFGTLNGTANTKHINVRLGASLVSATYAAADTGSFFAEGYIYFTGADTQYMFMKSDRHLGSDVKLDRASGTNVMTADVNLTLEASVDTATDSVVIDMFEVGWAG